jgi:cysteine-rich repeat protein
LLALWACAAPADPSNGSIAVRSEIVQCPTIRDVSATPLEVVLGGKITVRAQASYGVPHWRATSGRFADAGTESTTYDCQSVGTHTLTFELTAGPECDDQVDVQVQCSASPFCGDGHFDLGEQCDDGNLEPDHGCSPDCALEVD